MREGPAAATPEPSSPLAPAPWVSALPASAFPAPSPSLGSPVARPVTVGAPEAGQIGSEDFGDASSAINELEWQRLLASSS